MLYFMPHLTKTTEDHATMTSWLLTLPGFQTNAFLPSGHGKKFFLLHIDTLTLSGILPLKYLQNGALPLCFHEVNTEK